MTTTPDPDRLRVAIFAFAGHVFGIWVLGRRLGPGVTLLNRLALAATAIAMVAGGFLSGPSGVLVAWLVGHFGWGTYLAREVWLGHAGFRPEPR